jgi:hypothetical protein
MRVGQRTDEDVPSRLIFEQDGINRFCLQAHFGLRGAESGLTASLLSSQTLSRIEHGCMQRFRRKETKPGLCSADHE